MNHVKTDLIAPERRAFLARSSGVALSAAAIAVLAGTEALAQGMSAAAADVSILNVALALEHEAIGAYQLGAQSGLLQQPVLDVAVLFQGHHKGHRDALASTIRKLGGNPVAVKPQTDVLELAARLELGATNAYLGVIPSFRDAQLAKVAARLAADETMHWSVLSSSLGKSLPKTALYFGA